MKKAIALLFPVLLLSVGPVLAGEDDKEHQKRCGAEASTCIRDMADKLKQRGWIGIEWEETDGRPRISHVVQGSPAATAGVQVGDVVVAFNGVPTNEDDEVVWAEMKRSLVPGNVVTLSIVRAGAASDLRVELVAVPDHIIAQWVGMHVLEHHAAAPDDEIAASP